MKKLVNCISSTLSHVMWSCSYIILFHGRFFARFLNFASFSMFQEMLNTWGDVTGGHNQFRILHTWSSIMATHRELTIDWNMLDNDCNNWTLQGKYIF